MKYRGVQVGQVVSITASFEPDRSSVNIPVVIEFTKGAVEGVHAGGDTVPLLIRQGLRARLESASLITGQLFVGLDIYQDAPIREASNSTGYPIIKCRRKARMSPLSKAGMSVSPATRMGWESGLGLGDDERT